jgi:cyclophilin family peptidyl-prolyl cis-trans isomerase
VGTTKRQRQKQGRQARIAQAQAAAARRKRLRTGLLLGGLVVLLVGGTLAYAAGQDDEDDVATDTSVTSSTVAGQTTSTTAEGSTPTIAVTIPPAGASIEGETPCPAEDGSSDRTTQFESAPPTCIDPEKTYTATVTTTMGEFTLELDDATAPTAVNNFVVLARYHYYDGVAFHRIIPGFMIQGGDAVGPSPGVGGPGYSIPDELPAADATGVYPEGTLAMANSGPDTGGSQFFVVVGSGGDGLSNDYTPFGRVTSGIEVVREINQLGDAASNGTPTAEVNIETITIAES